MNAEGSAITVALLAAPSATGSTLFGLYDMLSSAGRDWSFATEGRPGRQVFEPVLVAASEQPVTGANGLRLLPEATLDTAPAPDIAIVPELLLPPQGFDAGLYSAEAAWLRKAHDGGAVVASICSGAVLLAATGLLDGEEATTHWAYCGALAEAYPDIRVQCDRALVASGVGERILTSGGGTSWYDLALYLIARFCGVEEAIRIARLYLIDWHREGQSPFAALTRSRQTTDPPIARAQDWAAAHYADPAPVAGMAAASGLPERSFKRRFRHATGLSPMDYVQRLRLEEAKQMLETEDRPVEEIAREVGYDNASFFRRLFSRHVGLTPRAYRRRFSRATFALART